MYDLTCDGRLLLLLIRNCVCLLREAVHVHVSDVLRLLVRWLLGGLNVVEELQWFDFRLDVVRFASFGCDADWLNFFFQFLFFLVESRCQWRFADDSQALAGRRVSLNVMILCVCPLSAEVLVDVDLLRCGWVVECFILSRILINWWI